MHQMASKLPKTSCWTIEAFNYSITVSHESILSIINPHVPNIWNNKDHPQVRNPKVEPNSIGLL